MPAQIFVLRQQRFRVIFAPRFNLDSDKELFPLRQPSSQRYAAQHCQKKFSTIGYLRRVRTVLLKDSGSRNSRAYDDHVR